MAASRLSILLILNYRSIEIICRVPTKSIYPEYAVTVLSFSYYAYDGRCFFILCSHKKSFLFVSNISLFLKKTDSAGVSERKLIIF